MCTATGCTLHLATQHVLPVLNKLFHLPRMACCSWLRSKRTLFRLSPLQLIGHLSTNRLAAPGSCARCALLQLLHRMLYNYWQQPMKLFCKTRSMRTTSIWTIQRVADERDAQRRMLQLGSK